MDVHSFLFLLSFLLILKSSVQLQCVSRKVQAWIGGTFTLACSYDTRQFLFSKKYWCRGKSRSTCEILKDTERFTKAELKGRIDMYDAGKGGLLVVMRDLQFADTGTYWIGIDKIYADLMTSIIITVSEVAVSQPRLRFLSPASQTCWGQPLTVRCLSDQGTNVRYGWYKSGGSQDTTLGATTDLQLQCGVIGDGEQYYCNASNSVSSKRSHSVFVRVLRPAEEDCVYILTVEGEHQYDCWALLSTSTALPMDTTEVKGFVEQSTAWIQTVIHSKKPDIFLRARRKIPVWYEVLRWLLLASLLTTLCLVQRCCRAQC